jgi:hypothetical protein
MTNPVTRRQIRVGEVPGSNPGAPISCCARRTLAGSMLAARSARLGAVLR